MDGAQDEPPDPGLKLSLFDIESYFRTRPGQLAPESLPCHLKSYILTDIFSVLNAAFRTEDSISYFTSSICSRILRSSNSEFISSILHAPGFDQYIFIFLQFLHRYRMESQTLFFSHLSELIHSSNGEFWQVIDAPSFAFWTVNNLYLDPCCLFVTSFLDELYSDCQSDVSGFSFPSLLVQQFMTNSKNSVPSFNVIESALQHERFARDFGLSFLTFLEPLTNDCFSQRNSRYADFLRMIFTKASELKAWPYWIRISDAISAQYKTICDVFITAERFTAFENSIGKLFHVVSKDRKFLNERTLQVIQHIIQLMSKFPTNSFLANFVVVAVQIYADMGGSMKQLLDNTSLIDEIIQSYSCQECDRRAYSGQVRILAQIIDPWVNEKIYPAWEEIVIPANRRAQEIIQSQDPCFFGKDGFLAPLVFFRRLSSPTNGKLVIWGTAMFFVLIIYASCVL